MTENGPIRIPNDWLSAGHETAVDCETAVLLRAALTPTLRSAESWQELTSRLDRKGYKLVIKRDRLVIVESTSGRSLCTGRYLGAPLESLAERLGRPRVKTCGQIAA
ncbi:hypothetical protein ACFORG_05780 [Lutimaribacter marinistellae]|uniref:Uncharacterized protein n=1 Tax=Lutimaribacter marinistellae TaxID=1820329 RepID=A0ABV7TE83_9RHOB